MVLIIIGIEVYLFVKPRKSDISTGSNKEYVVNKDNLKYIVDTSTSYFKNGLSYKLEKSDNKYYVLEINSGVMIENYIKLTSDGVKKAKKVYEEAVLEMFK